MGTDASAGIAAYYDHLSRFLDVARIVGRGGGAAEGSTHRFLAAADGSAKAAAPGELDRTVLEAAVDAGLPKSPTVLDAGCGLGGTIFHWHKQLGGAYDGLTLSPEQRRRAELEAERRTISDRCRFQVRSYHDPLAGPYDAAVAIESLAHSADPAGAIANIAGALRPGGLLLIVDDMPDEDTQPSVLAAFKSNWRCPVLLDHDGFRTAFACADLSVVREIDLTQRLRPRPLAWLKILIALFSIGRHLAPTTAMRGVIEAFIGGFQLEALYRLRAMRYRLIVARRISSN